MHPDPGRDRAQALADSGRLIPATEGRAKTSH